ncbi:hypothetical protein [Streptomyces brasiliensis]|uniref:Secreted protein n=1 Tax=Streptomyces brasiliensis TaxID=1954 RepID=A0A917L3W7_9ACTN|nr:hypothetical protein [Streptomyces brasiliensis]GGJ43603.1 hypothetical protein GCM10010121_063540 [Streptomyces brasiliensis]
MSTAPSLPHGQAWLRSLVLLLALLVPSTHADVHAVQVAAVDVAEHVVLDTALRPPSRTAHHPDVPEHPAPAPVPAPPAPEARPFPAPPQPQQALHTLRSVVLRC